MIKERSIHIRMTEARYRELKKLADATYRKVTGIVDEALDQYFKSRKR